MRRRWAALLSILICVVGAVWLLSGATTSTEPPFVPMLDSRIPDPAVAPTLAEPPAGRSGRWYLSPPQSRLGQAVTRVVGAQEAPRVVVAVRNTEDQGFLSGTDRADLRGADGGGYEVDWYYAFARSELDGAATAHRAPNGTYWLGGQDEAIQSLYYLSDGDVGLWIGHYSATREDRVGNDRLLTLAGAIAAQMERDGGSKSILLTQKQVTG